MDIPQAAMGWIPISRDYDVREEYAAEGDGSSSDEADDVQYAGAPGKCLKAFLSFVNDPWHAVFGRSASQADTGKTKGKGTW